MRSVWAWLVRFRAFLLYLTRDPYDVVGNATTAEYLRCRDIERVEVDADRIVLHYRDGTSEEAD